MPMAMLPRNTKQQARSFTPAVVVGLLAIAFHALLLFGCLEPVVSFGPTVFPTTRKGIALTSSSLSPIETSSSSSISESESQTPGKDNLHVVVVGGGVGGMAVAARIASEQSGSTKVTILEKNPEIGGRCGSFWVNPEQENSNETENNANVKNGFRHEQGPSLLLLPSVYEDVFRETTSKTALDYGLEIVQCSPAYQVVFDDGDRISVGFPKGDDARTATATDISEEESASRSQMDAYEEHGAAKWDEYMAITEAYLDAGLPNFIEEKLDLWSLPNFLFQSLKDSAKAWPLKTHSEVLDVLFESNKLRALASFQDLYVGLEPYKNPDKLGGGVFSSTAPAVFGLLAAIELHPTNQNAGVFAPIGGFAAVTKAFENLLDELNVEIRCDTTVLGVTNEGVWAKPNQSGDDEEESEFLSADLVIVNADLPYAKKSLLIPETKTKSDEGNGDIPPPQLTDTFDWDDRFSFSSGVISFYWSLDKPLDDLNTHNVFLSTKSRSQAEASWQVLREPPTPPRGEEEFENDDGDDRPFNFYVHRPSKTDSSAAPPGCDTIMVLVPCRTLLRDEECSKLPRAQAMERYQEQFSPQEVAKVRKAVLKRFAQVESLQNLEEHILHEDCRTPATWADRYNLAAGTPFALSHGFAQLSLTRPGPQSTGLSNVLYCGASTRPGNGVPLVLIGAKQVAEKAARCLSKSTATADE